MGIGINKIYCTKIDPNEDLFFLSGYVPDRSIDEMTSEVVYRRPKQTPIGKDMFYLPNIDLELDTENTTIEVELEITNRETRLYLLHCKDSYFYDTYWLCNYKPEVNEKGYIKPSGCETDDFIKVNPSFETEMGSITNIILKKKKK